MREVLPTTILAAQQHALQLVEQSIFITDIAHKLQNGDSKFQELGQNLETYAATIHEHAHKSFDLAHSLELNPLTDVLRASTMEHIEASRFHIDAVSAYIETVKAFLKSAQQL